MRARLFLRSATAALTAFSLALPAGAAAPRSGPLDIRVGEAKDFSHIEFHWSGAVKMGSRREGQDLILTFNRQAQPDLTRLRVDPPRFLKSTDIRAGSGGLELVMHLSPDADAKVGWGDGAPIVNLFARRDPPPAAAAPPPTRPNPAPASGVVPVRAQIQGQQLDLSFTWGGPVPAAVFRRGEAVWVVFDGKARLAIPALPKGGPQIGPIRQIQGADFTALRIPTPSTTLLNAFGQGPNWTVVLGPGVLPRPTPVSLGRDPDAAPAGLAAMVSGSSRVIWITDPAVGDRIAVVTALGPAKGLAIRRDFVELTALPSVQGLAVETGADDLSLRIEGDFVRISRPNGLKLSPTAVARTTASSDAPRAAAFPGLIKYAEWAQTGPGGFLPRYDALVSAAAEELDHDGQGGKAGGIEARMALARFLVGSELDFEAIGVLDSLARKHPEVLNNAEFRGLRGASRAMARRYKEAQADFSSPALAEDPASALWRGFAAAKLGQWVDARSEFQKGLRARTEVDPKWRAAFARADAEAALNLGDFTTAANEVALALALPQSAVDQLADRLLQARVLEATGETPRALAIFDAVAKAPLEGLATEASLHATQIRLAGGGISPDKAAARLDGLRFRWRGDAIELDVIRGLGQLYLNQGRYREALEALRSAGNRLPDLPQAAQLQADLTGAFRALFLDGQADGLEPVQALALFYDFKSLTPVGADGDEMVRKLARRLVDVDLLDQASELLKYQADNRLDGVPRAVVATDLATVQLMARRPEQALDALNSSRTTLLPTALQNERRIIEARAWLQLNQLDHAQEILGKDASRDAEDLRAEIAWKRRDWPLAGKLFEAGIADRSKTPELPLSGDEESKLLRAAIAYSLGGDDAALTRLRDRFGGFVEHARQPDALRVALSGLNGGQIGAADLARAVSEDASFAGWVAKMKAKMREREPLQLRPPVQPLKTAEAAGAPAKG